MNQPVSSSDSHAPLRTDIRLLGGLLGETIREQDGEAVLALIEEIRHSSKAALAGDASGHRQLEGLMAGLDDDSLLPVVRSFGLMLNLMNIAEQYHRVRRLSAASTRETSHRKS
ncbi:hypothetical protein A9Q90_05370, partial [Gammaproteobacteria bacterium 54_18_T64]